MTGNLAIYIHWPYCQSKCPYCDFNSHVAATIDHTAMREAYARELEYYAARLPARRIASVFFGGGTPSLMAPKTVENILQNIARHWQVDKETEITLEANPGSAEAEKFAAFRAAGVNRLSLGVQALDDDALKFLGRRHDAADARRAIDLAKRHFPRFSFDLIYARKGQTLNAWQAELRAALALADGHLSLYQLTIEPGTQFHTLSQRGELLSVSNDEAAAMYETTQEILDAAGLPAYEVSNHAQKGQESRHNLAYWRYEDYIGIGAGAHGRYRLNTTRLAAENHRVPEVWLKHVNGQGNGLRLCEALDENRAMREALMMGLRLTEGIASADWRTKFSVPIDEFVPAQKIRRLEHEKYAVRSTGHLKLTAAGLERLNAVLEYLTIDY